MMCRPSAEAIPSRRVTRLAISSAAFLVKVTARMRVGAMPCRMRCTSLPVSVLVFPEPGPASVSWMAADPLAAAA